MIVRLFYFELTCRTYFRPSIRLHRTQIVSSQFCHIIESIIRTVIRRDIQYLSQHIRIDSDHQELRVRHIFHRCHSRVRTKIKVLNPSDDSNHRRFQRTHFTSERKFTGQLCRSLVATTSLPCKLTATFQRTIKSSFHSRYLILTRSHRQSDLALRQHLFPFVRVHGYNSLTIGIHAIKHIIVTFRAAYRNRTAHQTLIHSQHHIFLSAIHKVFKRFQTLQRTHTHIHNAILFKTRHRFSLYRLILIRIRIHCFHRFQFRLRFGISGRIIVTTCHKTTHCQHE